MNIKEKIKELEIKKQELLKKQIEEANIKYYKNKASRLKRIAKDNSIRDEKILFLKKTLKPGDIIRCKGYHQEKKVVLLDNNYVHALCGRLVRRNEIIFQPNGSGSATAIENVTEVFKDKWLKIKDLL